MLVTAFMDRGTRRIPTLKPMKETSKALKRRMLSHQGFWKQVFGGKVGYDLGCGDDPLPFEGCKPFDITDGDAQELHKHVEPGSLDYIHASQLLEHVHDPRVALTNWLMCLKPGGYIVVTVPDFDLYEKKNWPSCFNPDHKTAWSLWRKGFPEVPLIHVPTLLSEFELQADVELCHLVDTNYSWDIPDNIDQTFIHGHGVECFIEFVLLKHDESSPSKMSVEELKRQIIENFTKTLSGGRYSREMIADMANKAAANISSATSLVSPNLPK